MSVELVLPYPPSVNHYWVLGHGRLRVSDNGIAYRGSVAQRCGDVRLGKARLSVDISVHPPDRRRRDLDNTLKALLDALAASEVYENDEQIDRLYVRRSEMVPGGMVVVTLETLGAA